MGLLGGFGSEANQFLEGLFLLIPPIVSLHRLLHPPAGMHSSSETFRFRLDQAIGLEESYSSLHWGMH